VCINWRRQKRNGYFSLLRNFRQKKDIPLTDQIRRSSRAVNAMIAESWARRRYPAAFVNKPNEALGEAMETSDKN
jgi:four helix bundle protein